ncbi:Oidioi.mRNA.OKI2018_I69.XSR.g15300.t1.cds [Oikopleura dioica]|uniref:Oidioi.mRNA.OKI2018_I69.XSR.g15300.t1.cds n=1 Tax=Oikopleura dioica TaxID=34765 RepID=A0ABN7SCD5_OIKDI|nr:Oidioi.mRNA.OKI2018_I69.XSR.g15300.t1.cds [Oikopleura dioica]
MVLTVRDRNLRKTLTTQSTACVITTKTVNSCSVSKTPEFLRKKATTTKKTLANQRQSGKSDLKKALFTDPIKISDFKKSNESRRLKKSACQPDLYPSDPSKLDKKIKSDKNYQKFLKNVPSCSTPMRKTTRRKSDTDALPPKPISRRKGTKRCFEEADEPDQRKPKLTQVEIENRQQTIFSERIYNVLIDRYMDEICEVLDDFENEDLRSKSRAIARAIVNNAKTSAASATVTFNRIYQNLKRKSNKFLFTALIENQIKTRLLPAMTAVELDPKGAASKAQSSRKYHLTSPRKHCPTGKFISGQLVYLDEL